jgi:hypothetical protein
MKMEGYIFQTYGNNNSLNDNISTDGFYIYGTNMLIALHSMLTYLVILLMQFYIALRTGFSDAQYLVEYLLVNKREEGLR